LINLATKHFSERNNMIAYRLYHPLMDSTELFNRKSVLNSPKTIPTTPPESIETFIIGSHDEKSRIVKANRVKFIRPASAFDKRPVDMIVDHQIRPKSAPRQQSRVQSCDIIKHIVDRAKRRPQSCQSGKSMLNSESNELCKISRPQSGASVTTVVCEDLEIIGQRKYYGDPFPSWVSNKSEDHSAPTELEIMAENILSSRSYSSNSESRTRRKQPTIVGNGYDLIS
jgi:hypothetical protein